MAWPGLGVAVSQCQSCRWADGDLTVHDLGQVDLEWPFFGVAVREYTVIGESPAKGIGKDHHHAFRFRAGRRRGDVAVQAVELGDLAGWHAGVQAASRAALFESGHGGYYVLAVTWRQRGSGRMR